MVEQAHTLGLRLGVMQPANAALLICALVLTTALPLAAQASDPVAPVMVEIDPDPDDDWDAEWVELYNPAPVDLPLDGLYLTDHDACFAPGQGFVQDYHWPLTGAVPAQSHLVLELPSSCLNLANSGDLIELVTEDGTVLQSVGYGEEGDLPVPADGQSLAACHVAGGLHGPWTTAQETRGALNPGC